VSEVIAEDTGLSRDESTLLAVALIGTAHVSARWWLSTGSSMPRQEAERLVSILSWRGIRGFPRAGEPPS
jgi:hypothetical protein